MAEGMEVEAAPAIRDKKRFEVKKVSKGGKLCRVRVLILINAPFIFSSGMQWLYGHGVSL